VDSNSSLTKIWGTSPDSIDIAEDRERFEKILHLWYCPAAEWHCSVTKTLWRVGLDQWWYVPCWGVAMEIVYSDAELERYMTYAVQVAGASDFD